MATPMERAPDPGVDYVTVPKERYTSAEFAEREWQHMWRKVWLMAGRESDVPNAGDYFTFEIGPESLLIIRQRDGALAARFNVCMHRGNRLREPGRGHADKFSCIFHGWEYGIDGRLEKALDEDCFPQGIPRDALSLQPVRVDTWAGFVFVCLDPEAESLQDYLGIIPEHLDPYGFENWKLGFDCTMEIECNWKTCVDAFNEAYHVAATHTWTLPFTDDVGTTYDCYERHTRMIFPELVASQRLPTHGQATPEIVEMFLKRVGVSDFQGDGPAARTAFANQLRSLEPVTGADFSKLNESQMCDDFHYTIFPNVTFNTHSMFLWVFLHRPHPSDPNKMYFDFFNLVNTPEQDVPRPEKIFLRSADGDTFDGVFEGGDLLDEDLYNLTRVQNGMRSQAFQGLHLGTQEVRILHHHRTLMDYLEREQRNGSP